MKPHSHITGGVINQIYELIRIRHTFLYRAAELSNQSIANRYNVDVSVIDRIEKSGGVSK